MLITLKDLLCSEIRRNAIFRMLKGPVLAADITKSTTANTITALGPLLKGGWVEKEGHRYHLTQPGEALA